MRKPEKNLTKKNLLTAGLLQVVTLLHGFLLPKIILTCFGSEVNGMVSSITQFLNYIQILEGGLGAVVMASLYKPLAQRDMDNVSAIIRATELFFRRIALIYVAYAIIVAGVFPFVVDTSFSFEYVAALVLTIALGTFIQYFFALPYRLLINADKHGYIVSLAHIFLLLVSTVLTLVAAVVFPRIHIIRLAASMSYVIMPVIFTVYVRRRYPLKKDIQPDQEALKQRWDAFGQNLAYFIHNNTDMVLLSLFATLADVSVYAVYSLIVVALRNLIKSLSEAIGPSVGREMVTSSRERLNVVFDRYELGLNAVSTVVFSCCAVLIVPFVGIYTAGIHDANYHQPTLAMLLTFANLVYCCRDSFRNMIYIAGHIRQTSRDAYIEAAINVILSALLVRRYGLVGVGVGTAVAMVYRMICLVWYVKRNILHRSLLKWVKGLLVFWTAGFLGAALASLLPIRVYNYISWLLYAVATGTLVCIFVGTAALIFYHKEVKSLLKK